MANERGIVEAIDACRPGSNDLDAPEMNDLARRLKEDRRIAAAFESLQRWDVRVGNAVGDVPVPEGLQARILARLMSAEPDRTAWLRRQTVQLLSWVLRRSGASSRQILLAFLRPLLRSGTLMGNKTGAGPSVVAVVLDASASMQYRSVGHGPFERAKAAVLNVLQSLGEQDRVNLIVAAAAPQPVFPEPSSNLYMLLQDVRNLKPTQERANLNAAIAEAVRQLSAHTIETRELYLVSDVQRSNWADVDLSVIPEHIKTVFVFMIFIVLPSV